MLAQPTDAPTNLGGAWLPVGPAQVATAAYGKVTGRVTSIAADPADLTGNTVYLGTTGGGVWRSTNAAGVASAVVFSPLTDTLSGNPPSGPGSLSIGAVTVQPGATGVVLAGTGDPNDALDSYWGSGILRSTDRGNTWSLITHSNESFNSQYSSRDFAGEAFAGFAWSTATTGLVVAAVSESIEGVNVNATENTAEAGLYYSMDAGATWLLATVQDAANAYVQAPQFNAHPGAAATAIVWNPIRQRFYAAIRFHGYYESTDAIHWTRLASQPSLSLSPVNCPSTYSSAACPIFRGALAVQPTTGDLFAFTTDINNVNQGIWRDPCSASGSSCASPAVNFASIPSQPLQTNTGVIPQGDYNLWLAAVPVSGNTILYAGTEDIFRCSLIAGCNWRNTTNVNTCAAAQVAPAQHAVDSTFAGSSSAVPGLMYFGNDGGLWRTMDGVQQTAAPCSSDDPAHFQNLNSGLGSLAEIVDLATDPVNPAVLLAAQGTLGTTAANPPGQAVWPQVLGGEGSEVAIDPNNSANWFTASTSGVSIHACTQGDTCSIAGFGATVIGSAQVGGDGAALPFPAPWILDPQDTTRIIVGTCRVWRGPTSGGSNWSAANQISPFLDGAGPSGSNPVCTSNGIVRSLAASGTVSNLTGNQEIIYAGMAGALDGGSTVAGRIYSAAIGAQSGPTTVWTDLSTSQVSNDIFANNGQFNPGGFAISSIAVDPHDTTGATIYVSIQGFSGAGISEPRVYASKDGGAHWLNVTSNLPGGPVNSVIVDPQDANTVYLGLDIGVYVARQISNCSTAGFHCWSPYGTGLPDAPITELNIFNAQSQGSGSTQGQLQAATYGRGVWQITLLITQTTGTLAPGSLTFADQAISTASAAQPLTLTNTGTMPLDISQITLSTDYSETDNCNGSVAVGANCTLQVTFTPSALGARPGTIVIYADIPTGQLSATLSGNGVRGGVVVLVPASLDFGNVPIGTTAPTQNLTISNTGGGTVVMTSESARGDYGITANTCTATLPPSTGCTVSIAFTPTVSGSRTGALTVIDSAGTQTLALTGTGLSAATDALSPLILAFSGQKVNTSSAPQPVTLTNSGDQSLTLIGTAVSGNFAVANGCGTTLVGHASCVINVTYAPIRVGSETGVLTVSDAIHSQSVALSGTGTPATTDEVAPASLLFAAQPLNTVSSPQNVTLINSSDGVLTLISAQVTGDFVFTSGCPPSVQAHSSCSFAVSYLPTRAGAETGTLLISDANGTQTIPLNGTGVVSATLSASPSALSFGSINLGFSSAPQTVTFANQSTTGMNSLAFAIAGDYAIVANNCPAALPSGTSCALQIVFTPTAGGSRPGTLTATSSSLAGAVIVPLTGTGQTAATDNLSPSSLDFGSVPLNTASVVRHIALSNSGTVALTAIAAHTTGAFLLGQSTCGPTLAAGASCVFGLEFLPTTPGANSGSLVMVDSIQSQTVPLTGFGSTSATDALTPATLAFGNQVLNTKSPPQQAILSNTGDSTLSGISVQITGEFTLNNLCGATLPAHTTCTMTVTYQPTIAGAETGVLTVTDASRSQTVTLTGTGLNAPTDALTPPSLTFFPQALNTSSPPQAVTLTNSGGSTLTDITASITGDFNLTTPGTCGATLAAGASCIFNVVFLPTHIGVESGTLTVVDSIRTQTVALNGPLQSSATDGLTPLTLAFGSQPVGVPSTAQAVTLTNTGDATLTGIKTTITGDFSVTSTCGVALVGHSTCTLSVIYTPTHASAATGTLTVTDVLQAQKVTLSGTGTVSGTDALTPASLAFSSQALNTSSAPQAVTLTNSGTSTLTGITAAVSGAFTMATDCGATLAAGANCVLNVSFLPTKAGAATGTLTVTDVIQAQKVTLSGTGAGSGGGAATFTLNNDGAATATVSSGQTASYIVDVVPVVGSTGTVTMSCAAAGLPPFSSCSFAPSTVTLVPGTTTKVAVSIATGIGISLSSTLPSPLPGGRLAMVLACVLPLGLIGAGRRLRGRALGSMLLVIAFVALTLSMSGCGGANVSSGTQSHQNVTPAGAYTLTVQSTLGTEVESATVTLTVK